MPPMLDDFLSLFAGETPKRTVWTADITYWLAGRRQAGSAKPEWSTADGFLQLHNELGILPYYYYEKFWSAEPQYDARIRFTETIEGGATVRRFSTPLGNLCETSVYSPRSCSSGIAKHFVQTADDLDVLVFLLEHRQLVPSNLSDWSERRRMWLTHNGYPCIALPRSPLAAFFVEWAGVQNGSYLLFDCPEKVAVVLRLMEEHEEPILEAVCELAPPLVHFADNLSSDCTTGFYDRYMADAHRRRLERLHAAGIKSAVHLDGAVRGLLPKLIASGFDAIEALTPKPGGDLDFAEIRDLAGDHPVILWGGVPGIMFAPPYTRPQMETYVRRLLACWQGRPFILGVADQVPPDGDIEFCQKIAKLTNEIDAVRN